MSPHSATTPSKVNFDQRPMLVFWEVTRACQLACKHCRANAMAGALPGELDHQQGLDLIEQVAGFGRPYPILVLTERLTADRDTIMNAIQAENVGIGVHFRAVHLHPFYADTFGFRRNMFPVAEAYSDRTISLPLYPKMSDQDADDVVAAVRKVLAYYRR